MQTNLNHKALYAAFDRFPSRKGAAIHISRFAPVLFEEMGGGLLYVLGDDTLPVQQVEGHIEIVRFAKPVENFLKRTVQFGNGLGKLIGGAGEALQICHFRDPWSGIPILSRQHKYATIYEVNGLPSIELPYSYNQTAPETIRKIEALQSLCLREADHIVTPSNVIRDCVISFGISPEKVTVIPNGAELPLPTRRPDAAPKRYILYFGALQPWQGIETLLRAFSRLADLTDLHLVICASNYSGRAKFYMKLAERLELNERISWLFSLSEQELAPWREHALLSVAPLTECSRNVEQGCAPLKILESMAAGVPVIASDLPAVREIMTDGLHGRLVHPDRPGELARMIRVLLQYPEQLRSMGQSARQKIERSLTWEHATMRLAELYRSVNNRTKSLSPALLTVNSK